MHKHPANILIVDDDAAVLAAARLFLKQRFQYVCSVSSASAVKDAMAETPFDIVLLDMNYSIGEDSGQEGLSLINEILSRYPRTDIIPITAYGEIDLAVEAMKRGARDFVSKPWENEKLYTTITNLLENRNAKLQAVVNELIGESPAFKTMMSLVEKIAPTDANVLLLGENGVGKELIARTIHRLSLRKEKPFVKIDLGSLVESLFESELFGHVKGAFTDAKEDRIGLLESANGGTVLLDEIGNISTAQQARLLTVLEQRLVTRVGENNSRRLDIRVISATNANVHQMTSSGDFRQDFLYRINTVEIEVPPLRDRKQDISELTMFFLDHFSRKYNRSLPKMEKEAIEVMESYTWPGNIRELRNVIERLVLLNESRRVTPADLNIRLIEEEIAPDLNIEQMEKRLILKSLEKHKGNITRAAKDLGIDRQALYRRLEKYGL